MDCTGAKVSKGSVLYAQMIDEVHTLIGAGAAEGAIDAANILKPALARGELQCIGATTLDEYRKHIEKDPALERRFQPVKICPLRKPHIPVSVMQPTQRSIWPDILGSSICCRQPSACTCQHVCDH